MLGICGQFAASPDSQRWPSASPATLQFEMKVCKRRNTTSENNLNRFLPVWNPISSLFPSNHMVLIPDLRRGLWESEAIITGLQSEIHTTENQQKTSVWKNKINIYWTYCLFFVLSGLDVVGDSKKKALLLQRLQGDLSCLGGPSHCLKVKGSAEKDRGGNQGMIDFNKHLTSYSKKTHRNCGTLSIFCNCFLGAAVLSKWSTSTPTSSHASSAAAFKPFSAAASSADDTLPGTASRGSCKLCLHPSPFTTCKHLISWEISY